MGYAAFAFALGLTAGLLIRKTLPAMATALFGFIALRLIVQDWVRPRLLPPSELTLPLDEVQVGLVRNLDGDVLELRPDRVDLPNAWVHSTSVVDASRERDHRRRHRRGLPGIRPGHPGQRR